MLTSSSFPCGLKVMSAGFISTPNHMVLKQSLDKSWSI
jgi:hypothetical protein